MTTQKLTNNTYKNMLIGIKSNARLSIVALILHLISAPLLLINVIIYLKQYEAYKIARELFNDGKLSQMPNSPSSPDIYILIGVFATAAAVIIGLIIAINNFSYLHNKSKVDMTLSLPLTTRQRFVSDFFGGLISYIAPFLVSSVFTLIISFIGSMVTTEWNTETISNMTTNQVILQLTIGGFFIMIMTYTLAVLTVTCCGSFFETVAYTLGINALIPTTIYVVGYLLFNNCYGIDFNTAISPIIQKTSPIGGLIYLIMRTVDAENAGPFMEWLVPFIIITAMFFIGAWFLYKNRKAECVSKPFVYKAFYYIVVTAVTFCIACAFSYDSVTENVIPLIIFSCVTYLIFELITNRGFKKFWKSLIRYAVTIVAALIVIFSSDVTDGFGIVYQVPSAFQVASVKLNYSGVFGNFPSDDVVIKDEESIKQIIEMHGEVLENYKKDKDNSDYYGDRVKICYTLRSGAKIIRTYNVRNDILANIKNIERTDEFIDQKLLAAKSDVIYYYTNNTDHFQSYEIRFNYLSGDNNYLKIESEKDIENLFSAISADLKSLTDDQYFYPKDQYMGTLYVGSLSINLNKNYPNVIKFLNEKDPSFLNVSNLGIDYSSDVKIIKNQDGLNNISAVVETQDEYIQKEGSYYSVNCAPEVIVNLGLEKALYPQGIERTSYSIMINGRSFSVDEKYTETVKQLYDSLMEISTVDISEVGEYDNGFIFFEDGTTQHFDGKEDLEYMLKSPDYSGLDYRIVIESY